MTKKFSDLTSIDNLLAEDILAVVDTSETASRYITLANLTESVIGNAGAPSIISVLNDYDAGAGYGNGLKAGYLWHEGVEGAFVRAYKDGNYYLDYGNFTNTPSDKTDLKDFANSALFLRLENDDDGVQKIKTSDLANLGGNTQLITTTNLDEGSPAVNKYYTEERDQAHLEQNFEEQFNIYSGAIIGSNRDSLEAQEATFQSITQFQSNHLRFASSSNIDNYIEGQVLRIYGASEASGGLSFVDEETAGLSISLVPDGFTVSSVAAATFTEMSYKFALFNTITGEISEASGEQTVFIKSDNSDIAFLEAFNASVFVKVTGLGGVTANKGVLVYRKISGTDIQYKLIAVLGEKEVSQSGWIDYMAFDYVKWSGKNPTYNSYTSIPHFPLVITDAMSVGTRGWVDGTIASVSLNEAGVGGFDIILKDKVFVNPPVATITAAQVYHNDTSLIQNAINSNSNAGKKGVMLNARPYNVTGLTVPNNFGLAGTRSISKIKKLPWSGGSVVSDTSSIIKSSDATASQISLVGIDIDGNSSYQFLFADSSADNLNINYALDFGTGASSIILDGVRVKNVSAGGLWAPEAIDLSVRSGEFINSGVSDRNPYSPISSPGSESTFITGNKIKNYSEHVDVATTRQGVITNNIVENCGSGIYVYGSTFFLSSSNVLMGPAGEFLPSPDILNSAYDSININLTAQTSGSYSSDSMVYQENGAAFDLTANSIPTTSSNYRAPELIYRAFYIQKDEKGVEEAYGTGTTAGSFIPGIRYMITSLGDTTQAEWNTAASTSNVIYEEGDSFIAAGVGTTNDATPAGTATSGGVDAIQFGDVSGTFRELGEFKFQISASLVNSITQADQPYSYSTLKAANNMTNGTVGSEHVGIAWTASHRNYVKAGDLGTGSWDDPVDADSAIYTVAVTNQKYLTVDRIVTIDFNSGEAAATWRNRAVPTPSQYSGKITSIIGDSVKIIFKGTGIGVGNETNLKANTGSVGTLNIVDEFVLAKGRII
jgi:hypothetical protein